MKLCSNCRALAASPGCGLSTDCNTGLVPGSRLAGDAILILVMPEIVARLGGSRAQRDLLEFSLLECLLKQGKTEEARRLIALRRPVLADTHLVQGL